MSDTQYDTRAGATNTFDPGRLATTLEKSFNAGEIFARTSDRLDVLMHRTQVILDRVFGPQPEVPSMGYGVNEAGPPCIEGMVSNMERRLTTLENNIGRIDNAI